MQALASRVNAQRVAVARPATRAVRPLSVVCKANSTKVSEAAKKAAALIAAAPALLASSPAFALVDERLNGDGTGLPFGVNDGALGWAIAGVLSTIWAIYFTSQKDLGDFEDPKDGLGL